MTSPISISPSSLDFGSQRTFSASTPKSFTITASSPHTIERITCSAGFLMQSPVGGAYVTELTNIYVSTLVKIPVVAIPQISGTVNGQFRIVGGDIKTITVFGIGVYNSRIDSIRKYPYGKPTHIGATQYMRSDDTEWQAYVDGVPLTEDTLWYRWTNGLTEYQVYLEADPEPFWNRTHAFQSELLPLVEIFPSEHTLFWVMQKPNYPDRGNLLLHAVLAFYETASLLGITPDAMDYSWRRSWRAKRIETLAQQSYIAYDDERNRRIVNARSANNDRLVVKLIIEDIAAHIGYTFPSFDGPTGPLRITTDQSIRLLADGSYRIYGEVT